MIIYVPRLIESAEQAEQLPIGTQRLQDGREGLAVGFTALVPVTATVERMAAYAVMPDWDPERPEGQMATRYTTPWTPEEEA